MLTSEVPIAEIFTGEDPVKLEGKTDLNHDHVDHGMRSLMDDLGISMDDLLESSIFVFIPSLSSWADVGHRLAKRRSLLLQGRCLGWCKWAAKSGWKREWLVLHMHNP